MSDTPETDKAERMAFASEYMVPTEFARELERERDEARDQRNRLHELHSQNAIHHNELLELCVTLRKERDEAQNASEAFSALAWKLEGERNEAREAEQNWRITAGSLRAECDEMREETPWGANNETKESWFERQREKFQYLEAELEKTRRERDEAREKYDTLATEHMLEVNKLCNERDEAREELRKLKNTQ